MKRNFFILCAFIAALLSTLLSSCLDDNCLESENTIVVGTLADGSTLFARNKGNGEACVTYAPSNPTHLNSSNAAKISTYKGDVVVPQLLIVDHWAYTITGIDELAFANCNELISVQLPDSVKTLGEGAFCNCATLASVNIPEGIATIPNACFARCSKLQELTLPSTVKTIKRLAFYSCGKLKTLHVKATTPPEATEAFGDNITSITLYVPTGSKSLYEEHPHWKQCKSIKEE